jgi:hypothetical protein
MKNKINSKKDSKKSNDTDSVDTKNSNIKVSAIIYHKDVLKIYDEEWIEDCINSLKNQSFQEFIIYELNYGSDDLNICEKYGIKNKFKYFKKKFENHGDAINFLFAQNIKDVVDVVFNNNIDDYSHHDRFKIQLEKINEGYDIVSSNFQIINEIGEIERQMILSDLDIEKEISNEHNIICHPSVCYSRNFIRKNLYDGEEIPKEDLLLWKRTVSNFNFFICPDMLIYYRKHKNQITTQNSLRLQEQQEEEENERLLAQLNIVLDKKEQIQKVEEVIEEEIVQEKSVKNNSKFEKTFDYIPTINRDLCRKCGEPKNRVKFNYCQKCNSLY